MSLHAIRALNEHARCGLKLVELIAQGQSGAAFVRWPDDRDAVVTTALTSMQHMQKTAAVLAALKKRGIPVPEHQLLFPLDDGTIAVVQERLPGAPVVDVDIPIVDAIIGANERFAGLMAVRDDIPLPTLSLGRPADRTSVDPLETHSPRTRNLLRLIRKTADDRIPDIDGSDLVHVDLTVSNVLFDRNRKISGIVDWNYGVARGDRHYALSKLLHTLSFAAASPSADHRPTIAAVQRVDDYLTSTVEPATLRRYWAHHTLNMLHWTIRNKNKTAIDSYAELGESKLYSP